MSKQVKRLLLIFILIIGLFILVRHLLIPDSFYKYGPYRGDAVNEIASRVPKYQGVKTCATCHDSLYAAKSKNAHKGISCETCHGPGDKHVQDPATNILNKPSEREFCGKCHMKNIARPAFLKQIDITKHNIGKKCVTCHNPHSPAFYQIDSGNGGKGNANKITDATCGSCHNDIFAYKSKGVHKSNECQNCHGAGDKHIQDPSANKLVKPSGRPFCAKCHGKGIAPASSKITQVDVNEHNPGMDCKECHKPHSPLDF